MDIIARTESKGFKSMKKIKPMLFCVAHGKGAHSTEDCRIIKNLQPQGRLSMKVPAAINVAASREEEEENSIKTTYQFYSLCRQQTGKNNLSNSFFINCTIEGKNIKALLDTGADTSLINPLHLPQSV